MSKSKKEKTYIFCYLTDHDGDVKFAKLTGDEIRTKISNLSLTEYDYAIIDGELLKGFNKQTFDVNSL